MGNLCTIVFAVVSHTAIQYNNTQHCPAPKELVRRETPTGGFTLVLDAAMDALLILLDPMRLMFVAFGTLLGLMIGVIPGIGGLVGL